MSYDVVSFSQFQTQPYLHRTSHKFIPQPMHVIPVENRLVVGQQVGLVLRYVVTCHLLGCSHRQAICSDCVRDWESYCNIMLYVYIKLGTCQLCSSVQVLCDKIHPVKTVQQDKFITIENHQRQCIVMFYETHVCIIDQAIRTKWVPNHISICFLRQQKSAQ